MSEAALEEAGELSAVAEYKRIFKEVLDNRPSGMRLRLAHAMGKNRSFVSQISNPTYPVPIPVQHLNTIFEVCHFPPPTKAAFLSAYARAHPRRIGRLNEIPHERTMMLHLPDLGSSKRNAQLDALLQEFARRLIAILQDGNSSANRASRGATHEKVHQFRRYHSGGELSTVSSPRMPLSSRSGRSANSCFGARRPIEKVALISGGGSGHEPLHVGFVGTGMLDAACPGQIFTSPTPDQIVEAATSVGGKRRRALHRQELRRRLHELRNGRGVARSAPQPRWSPMTMWPSRSRPTAADAAA